MQSTLLKDSLINVVIVSYTVIFYCDLLSVLQISFYQLIECWSSFAISWCRSNWSYDKDYTHGLVDLLCHITQIINLCLVFKTYWKSAVAYIKSFPRKGSSLSAQPKQQCWEPKQRPLAQQVFPLNQVHRTNC